MKEKAKWMNEYPNEFKMTVVKEALDGISTTVLAKKYGIRNCSLIRIWKLKYLRDGEAAILNMKKQGTGHRKKIPKNETPEEELKQLRMENELLKKFHELLREEHKRK